MPGDWDDSLKMFIGENAQDFVSWLFEGAEATEKLLTEFKKRTVDADALIEAIQDGDHLQSY